MTNLSRKHISGEIHMRNRIKAIFNDFHSSVVSGGSRFLSCGSTRF